MINIMRQLKFDALRLVIRNKSFLFFTLLMPAGFYLLFTKVMVVGSETEMHQFYMTYMGSMTIYSGVIGAIFGVSTILKRDRDKGLVLFLQMTPTGSKNYYISVYTITVLLNLCAVIVLGLLARLVNNVDLSLKQSAMILLIVLVGQIPMILLGTLMSYFKTQETLSVASNLIAFPLAIVSGLWWPINTMPDWLQGIGKVMPTYFANNLLEKAMLHSQFDLEDIYGIITWIVMMGCLTRLVVKIQQKKGLRISEA
ncbi:ABC transporter permease [Lactobacillus sp. UCMA15818]|uniref:ABC transporter permease n=1 Tax=Lactobacillus sp. UCMA15818 TaxID=2583394 RepID=UPI0025B10125|nr:ABC transporter permease [Lactobacillus sp. UCMA15818]MDN2454354.1 ABC transporter permease [Lactobacillus sp. UCMA15818]